MPHLITVQIALRDSGWFVATSDDCPGLFDAYPDRERVIADIPDAIELLYLARSQQKVRAFRLSSPVAADSPAAPQLPFAAIPVDTDAVRRPA